VHNLVHILVGVGFLAVAMILLGLIALRAARGPAA